MEQRKLIASVIVGSRLHETHRDDSDWDYRGIHIHPLRDVISPFKKLKNTSWIEGDEDNTSYELAEFCKLATNGNATVLEVLFSDKIIETSPLHREMQQNWKKFMHAEKFLSASRGYGQNQFRKMLDYSDAGINNQPRTAKFIISFLRVMWQCEQFFLVGEFKCSLKESDMFEYITSIKGRAKDDIDIGLAFQKMNEMESRVSQAYSESDYTDIKPDYDYIEDFLLRAYTQECK